MLSGEYPIPILEIVSLLINDLWLFISSVQPIDVWCCFCCYTGVAVDLPSQDSIIVRTPSLTDRSISVASELANNVTNNTWCSNCKLFSDDKVPEVPSDGELPSSAIPLEWPEMLSLQIRFNTSWVQPVREEICHVLNSITSCIQTNTYIFGCSELSKSSAIEHNALQNESAVNTISLNIGLFNQY